MNNNLELHDSHVTKYYGKEFERILDEGRKHAVAVENYGKKIVEIALKDLES